ncbi:hypothetical protein M9Y10_018603 [Tritrichomonas musculus]|uniref:Uncharacterized protein n=1 Tax=Tritrichomonas musculus TaxID=1915356 RepID=A0ABR2HMU1_9EUKA
MLSCSYHFLFKHYQMGRKGQKWKRIQSYIVIDGGNTQIFEVDEYDRIKNENNSKNKKENANAKRTKKLKTENKESTETNADEYSNNSTDNYDNTIDNEYPPEEFSFLNDFNHSDELIDPSFYESTQDMYFEFNSDFEFDF